MPLHTAEALVLRTYKLGEADRIVVFLTRDRGKKRGVAKGARRQRSAFAGALEPLTEVRVAYFESERRELVGLNYAETVRSPLMLASPAAATEAGHYMLVEYFAELLDEWAQDSDADDRLYRLGASMLDALTAGVPTEPLARYFEYWLLRLQGVYAPDPQASDGAHAFLTAARSCSPFAVAGMPTSLPVLRELEASHRALIRMHLEKDLRSVKVLGEIRR